MSWKYSLVFIFSLAFGNIPKPYEQAKKYIEQKRYIRASEEFAKFMKYYPFHPLKYKAAFYRAEALRFSKSYPQAIRAYEYLLSLRADENTKASSLLGMVFVYQELANQEKLQRYLNQLWVLYPQSQAAAKGKQKFKKLYLDKIGRGKG